MLQLLHVLNLDSIGGVERTFTSFLAHRSASEVRHGVLVLSRTIHPFLEPDVRARAAEVHAWKRAARGWRIPKWPPGLRARHRLRVARRFAPGVALFWNTLGEVDGLRAAHRAGLFTVHWERGLAWHRERQEAGAATYLRAVDVVLANSHAGRRILEDARGYRGPIEVCRNALRADARPARARPREVDPLRPLRLGVAARLVGYKGVGLALHALAELARGGVDATLAVAGTGPLEADLRSLGERLGLGERLSWRGAVADVGAFYDELDVLVHPALCEPCANVLLEAMARGVPVVAGLVDGNPELVRNGETGVLVPPSLPATDHAAFGGGDAPLPPWVYDPATDRAVPPRFVAPDQLAAAIRGLVEDPRRYAATSARAIEHVAREPSAEQQVEDVLTRLERWSCGPYARSGS